MTHNVVRTTAAALLLLVSLSQNVLANQEAVENRAEPSTFGEFRAFNRFAVGQHAFASEQTASGPNDALRKKPVVRGKKPKRKNIFVRRTHF